MSVGFPSQEFFADNSGKFANIKLDELTSKLGLTVKFRPSYSLWSNGLNKQNHASADITIKADTIINALTDSWCMSVGVPSQGFFADNGGEFANMMLDELTSKLGLTVRF